MADYTSSKDEAFFAAIGRLAVSWGHLELGLDITINIIHHQLGNKDREPVLPRALSQKVRYLRRAFKSLPIPDEYRPRYERLLDDITMESVVRHDIIHGAIIEHAEGTGEARAVRLLHQKTDWTQKAVDLSTRTIMEAASRAMKLGGYTLQLAVGLQEVVFGTDHEL